jgi:hypothetical protein
MIRSLTPQGGIFASLRQALRGMRSLVRFKYGLLSRLIFIDAERYIAFSVSS